MLIRFLLIGLFSLVLPGCKAACVNEADQISSRAATEELLSKPQIRLELRENSKWLNFVDLQKAGQARVVLRTRLISPGNGSKYLWDTVRVLGVIKNHSSYKFSNTLKVAHHSWESGVPQGECTIYLVPYNKKDCHLWSLLGNKASSGVSHVVVTQTKVPAEHSLNPEMPRPPITEEKYLNYIYGKLKTYPADDTRQLLAAYLRYLSTGDENYAQAYIRGLIKKRKTTKEPLKHLSIFEGEMDLAIEADNTIIYALGNLTYAKLVP